MRVGRGLLIKTAKLAQLSQTFARVIIAAAGNVSMASHRVRGDLAASARVWHD
jgi:hypothetical protein